VTAALFALLGSLAAIAGVMYAAWLVVHVLLPWAGRRVSGREQAFSRAAEDRARSLFLAKLTPAQRRSWLARRRFSVVAPSGARYTIAPYDPYNIRASDALFCLQVGGNTPDYDKLLAQKLLIECDEALFLAKANVRSYSVEWDARKEAAVEDCLARGLLLEA
jgi:hypothetical protein